MGIRVQLRGVNLSVLPCLLKSGRHEHDHMGCEVVTFDGGSLAEVVRRESRDLRCKAYGARSLYAVVVSDGMAVATRFDSVVYSATEVCPPIDLAAVDGPEPLIAPAPRDPSIWVPSRG